MLIHVTLEDETILLFKRYEKVWVAELIVDGYIAGNIHGFAKDVIQEGRYIIDGDVDGPFIEFDSKIARVIEVSEELPTA